MEEISELIQQWYKKNKRDLPWRNTNDPYKIWLSEIILQQTKVAQGLSYYYKFINAYPNVKILAEHNETHILKNWQGLGYYSRARNLLFAAHQIINEFKGEFPTQYNNIIKLKGVGEYTAAAIASFAYGKSYAVVDGNVYRVLSRLFTINTPINSSKGKKEFAKLAQFLLDVRNPGGHNQAMMELGALICRPQNPNCKNCPSKFHCKAFKLGTVEKFPVNEKRIKIKKRYLNYLLVTDGNNMLLNKRAKKGIWQGLYDFPLIETEKEINEILKINNLKIMPAKFDLKLKHLLTHQKIYAKFWIVELENIRVLNNYEVIKINNLEEFPLPQLFVRYISQSKFFKR